MRIRVFKGPNDRFSMLLVNRRAKHRKVVVISELPREVVLKAIPDAILEAQEPRTASRDTLITRIL